MIEKTMNIPESMFASSLARHTRETIHNVNLTPGLAMELLKLGRENRNVRNSVVAGYARQIRDGHWNYTSEAISFNQDGKMMNGQHRCLAVVTAGKPIRVDFALGVPDSAFMHFDSGIRRSIADSTGFPKRLAETLTFAVQILGTRGITAHEVVEIGKRRGLASKITALLNACPSTRRYASSAPMRLAAATLMIANGEPDNGYAVGQYSALVNVDVSSMSPVVYSLHQQESRGRVFAGNKTDTLARGVIAFDLRNSSWQRLTVYDINAGADFVRKVLG